jgi:hypothetical protein
MDINAIKAKLKQLEQGKPKKAKWKPTDEHIVRVLPLPGDEDIASVVKWHYGVDNGRAMYCPSTDGEDCPFCDFAKTLKGWKDEHGHDKSEERRKIDWELFKKVDAAVKHYAPIVVRKKDSTDLEGPFLWEMTPKTYTALFKICANDDWNEDHPEGGGLKILTSLTHALDVVVTLKKKGEKGNTTNFDLTEVEERKKFSPLIKGDVKASEALLEKIPGISTLATPIGTAEAKKIFLAWKASFENGDLDTSEGTEHGGGGNRNAEKPATGGDSVDDVVAKLSALMNAPAGE